MNKKAFQFFFGIAIITTLYADNELIVDRDATQWLMLSVINTIALSYNIFLSYTGNLKLSSTPFSFKTLFVLFLWALLSIFYTLSVQVTIIDLSRLFLYLISYLTLIIILIELDISLNQLSLLFSLLLVYELYFPFIEYFNILKEKAYDPSMSYLLKGTASNKNITSFSIALKIPFLIFIFYKNQNKYISTLFLFLISVSYIMLNFLDTRAITLSNYIVILILVIYSLKCFKKRIIWKSTFLLMTVVLSFNLPSMLNENIVSKNRELISVASSTDESSNQRLRYYSAGLTQIFNNPVFGTGFGNWKLESIKYDKNSAKEYIVPYHMHNDFLQFGAELGIIGLLLYVIFFLSALFKYLKNKISEKKQLLDLKTVIVLVFFTYMFFDSNINFPFARPMIFIQFLIMISYLEKENLKI